MSHIDIDAPENKGKDFDGNLIESDEVTEEPAPEPEAEEKTEKPAKKTAAKKKA